MNAIYLFSSTVALGILLTLIYEKTIVYGAFKGKTVRIKGIHMHHSIQGLLFMALAMPFAVMDHFTTAITFCGIGVGVIIQHTLSEKKLIFMSRKH